MAGKLTSGNKTKHCWALSTNFWKHLKQTFLPIFLQSGLYLLDGSCNIFFYVQSNYCVWKCQILPIFDKNQMNFTNFRFLPTKSLLLAVLNPLAFPPLTTRPTPTNWTTATTCSSGKLEKILKGSLDSIPSPSLTVKIQIMGLRCKIKTLLGIFKNKKFVDPAMFCLITWSKIYCQCNDLNFHWRWRWWDRIQAIFLNIFYFNLSNCEFVI